MKPENIAVSPCSNCQMGLDEVLRAYSGLGYKKFEVFTNWSKSSFDYNSDPNFYLEKAKKYNMSFSSFHLPPIDDDIAVSLANAVKSARFAETIGVNVVLFKANSLANYIRAGKPFLDAIEKFNITPVLQNHVGSPISTLQDFREVLRGIKDERMKALLEVGQFHSVGVSWKQGCDFLRDKIALIHLKDQIGTQSVPFGSGEIDIVRLCKHMETAGYTGDFVVEMEVKDKGNTLRYLGEALQYLKNNCKGG